MAIQIYGNQTAGLKPGDPGFGTPYISSSYTSGGNIPQAPQQPVVPNVSTPGSLYTANQGGWYGTPEGQAWLNSSKGRAATASGGSMGGTNPFSSNNSALPPGTIAPQNMIPAQGAGEIAKNPWSIDASNAAVRAGQAAGTQAGANIGQADQMRTSAGQGYGAAGNILNTAFDPQNALRDRETQKLLDQVRVGEAARGITSSPYGAGVENQALSNFALDWQDRALGRQAQGIQGYATGAGTGRELGTTAGNVGQMGVGQTAQVGSLPYQQFGQNQQSDIQNWLAYINAQNAQIQGAQANYPIQLAQQSMQNAGGVPYISGGNTFNVGG